jgi:FixJ family two-component response regulator
MSQLEPAPASLRLRTGLQSRAQAVSHAQACVKVIDDDPEFLESLGRLLRSADLHSLLFTSIADFIGSEPSHVPTCLVLDVRLPGQSGLELQRDLATAGVGLPIIFITGQGDIPMSVQAMKAGAIEFLTKPFRDQDLLDAIQLGLARDRARREREESLRGLRARFERLTPRERAILVQVVEGKLNKQIAGELGITETTVKVHRSNMMRKLEPSSLAELCRMADTLKLLPERGALLGPQNTMPSPLVSRADASSAMRSSRAGAPASCLKPPSCLKKVASPARASSKSSQGISGIDSPTRA